MENILQKPKSSGKPRMQPQFPGIGGHSDKKMDFMDIGKRLYDLVGVELGIKEGKLDVDVGGKSSILGKGYVEGNKWGVGFWRNQTNPFQVSPNEPESKLGFHLTRRI